MVKIMRPPKGKKKPPKKYRKKEFNLWSNMINWVQHGYASVADWVNVSTNFNPDGSCRDRFHWLQRHENKTHCKVCGEDLNEERRR